MTISYMAINERTFLLSFCRINVDCLCKIVNVKFKSFCLNIKKNFITVCYQLMVNKVTNQLAFITRTYLHGACMLTVGKAS